MNSLTSITERVEQLMADGKLPEGDYLTLMNDLKKVYEAIPRPINQPAPEIPTEQGFTHSILATQLGIIRRCFNYNPSWWWIESNTGDLMWLITLDGYIAGQAPETLGFLESQLNSSRHTLIHIMRQACHLGHLWSDAVCDKVEAVRYLPAYRKALLEIRMDRYKYQTDLVAAVSSDTNGLVNLATKLQLPVYLRNTKKHYNKEVALDPKKHHPVRINLPTAGSPMVLNGWTELIQFGRTWCGFKFAQFTHTINFWRYINDPTNTLLRYGFQTAAINSEDIRNRYSNDSNGYLKLEVSGITAKTKNKSRVYSSPILDGFRLTYIEALNNPQAEA